ncbi:SH2 domain-containing protein A isoform X2 [Salvia miltiorrhiza]|uniref:SH2 domain-containing protein A isoform X2 n=1 Tax=Salvia miltiorrhiza TaxID=226208 RepID=UPI0025AC8FC8|nr:SH2 domain-containing protein A isoform X2 [Salvia miltiorrhiza]
MSDFSGVEEKDYVSLKNLKVEFRRDDDAEEADGCFALCFWIYIDSCVSFPSSILVQKHPDVTCNMPFLYLDDKKKMKLFPLLFMHKEAPSPDNPTPSTEIPCASTEIEFPMKKWVHVGCEVLRDLMRLHVDGEIVGENPLTCSFNKDLHTEGLKRLCLACPDENEDILHGYVHGLDIMFRKPAIKNHYVKDPPLQLSIDHSSASEIEEDSDGVWSIVGGKASCRRIFSLDVVLLDAFGGHVNKELEVVASLLYADNGVPVENTTDAEPPLLMNCDGIEYASHNRLCKLINGRASFKLKISQLSSKCDNRLFQIMFDVPGLGKYPFLGTLSLPIRCVSRSRNTRTASITLRKSSNRTYYGNGCESPSPDDGSMQLITNIVREAKPSPSSKRIKLGQDVPFVMFKEEVSQANKVHHSHGWTANQDNAHAMSMKRKPEDHCGTENNSCASDNSEATNSDPRSMLSVSSPISDLIIFKYCLGGPAEKWHLLKEIAISATEEQLTHFEKQVSLFSGCLHHRHQIKMAKRLVEEGIQAWTSVSGNNHHVLWENLAFSINEQFMKIACSTRPLMDQDLECLRRITGCRDAVLQEGFERMWSWLFPVAFTLSQSAVNAMWDSMSPMWIEGFITKEEAESSLQGPGGLQDPGTFLLRFPTSRSWPHPDAGNLVVTYVDNDYTIRHRLLSFDFIHSSPSKETSVKPLQDLLLQEPKLSRLGRYGVDFSM